MEIEQKIVSLPINENLQDEVEKLKADGWGVLPHVPSVAVYHLARVKADKPVASGLGAMVIDESKVFIRDKDGNIRQH